MASRETTVGTFGLLPCLTDFCVHAVDDPDKPYPDPVCELAIQPGFWLPAAAGPVRLCRYCGRAIHNLPPGKVTVYPAAAVRHRYEATQPGYAPWPLLEFWRRHLVRRFDQRIRHAVETGRWPRAA